MTDKQIKEIKEVIELPVKHPELFDALGIAQPKVLLLLGYDPFLQKKKRFHIAIPFFRHKRL